MERIVRLWLPIYHRGKLTNYDVSDDGRVRNRKTRAELRQREIRRINRDGSLGKPYYKVSLWVNGKNVSKVVHRLVAEAFIPNPENKPVPNHLDGNTLNNDVRNLEWATFSENTQHAYDTGLIQRTYGPIKYSDEDIRHVCNLIADTDISLVDISSMTGVAYSTVKAIRGKRIYQNITESFDFTSRDFDDNIIHCVCRLLEDNKDSVKEISQQCSASETMVYNIAKGNIKNSISSKYDTSKYDKIGPYSKVTEEQVHEVCRLISTTTMTLREISRITNVPKYTVSKINIGCQFKDISEQYDFSNRKKLHDK